MAKLKEFGITHYYGKYELYLICVTTSVKKFSELTGISQSHIKGYAYCYEPRTLEAIAEPDKLFARRGLGGKIREILPPNTVLTYDEIVELIKTK